MFYDPDSLIPGRCYFMVAYFDNEGRIPEIETCIFAGKNLMAGDGEDGKEAWYFQDPDSYLVKGPFLGQSPNEYGVTLVSEVGLIESTVHDLRTLAALLEKLNQQ